MRPSIRGVFLSLAFLCPASLAPAQTGKAYPAQAGWGLPALLRSMARIRSAEATFSETRTLPMLTTPLLASGTLGYVAPDTIRKTTLLPARQEFLLRGDEITMTVGPGGQTHRFSLAQYPAAGGLAEAIRATLAGDLPALLGLYTPTLSGSAAQWQLVLQPKDPGLAHFIAWMAIRGQADRIAEIDTASADGGRSELRISEAVLVAK